MNKKTYNKITLLFFCFLTATTIVFAQKAEYKFNKDSSAVSVAVYINKTKLEREDNLDKKRGMPLRIALNFPLKYRLSNIGTWKLNQDSTLTWKFELTVPGARGLIASFTDFYIPPGGKLYVYNISKNDFDACTYTNEDNPHGGPYSLEVFSQDNIVFEYVASRNIVERPRFETNEFGYKYKGDNPKDPEGFNGSAICMVNVNCPEAINWQKEKMGVVRLRINTNSASYGCTGSLINNTRNDKTPYVLTAQHCFPNKVPSDAVNTEFFFDYEYSGCSASNQRPKYKYKKGAQALVFNPINGGSDGALIKMTDTIPDDWTVYFNGWNLDNTDQKYKDGVVIHHPNGDVKKISFYKDYLISGSFNKSSMNSTPNTHWVVSYSKGSTEAGSSGSPLFDNSGLVMGTLTGGSSRCSGNSSSGVDYYGKMAYHFSWGTDSSQLMKKYLDPDNTGASTLSGIFNVDLSHIIVNTKEVLVEETYETEVFIVKGNGQYSAVSDNSSIASATVADNIVKIKGLNAGKAVITITDKFGYNVKVDVTVTPFLHKNLRLSTDVVTVTKDKTMDVNILSGNGDYELEVGDESIATATLIDSSKIEIHGKELGKTSLTLTDRIKKEVTIPIIVMNMVEIYVATGELNVRINNEINKINWVTISDLSGRLLYDSGKIKKKIFWTDITKFPKGTYLVMIKIDNRKKITKKVAW